MTYTSTTALLVFLLTALAACSSSGNDNNPPPPDGGATTFSATLTWDIPTHNNDGSALDNLSAFRVIYGQSQADMDKSIVVSNPGISSYVVDGLAPGTYFFKVRTVNAQGVESSDSNIASIVLR